jgi:flagellar biosynthetic protein FlhB
MRTFRLQLFAEERTEPATPRKRQKTREEGQVARSKDLGAAVVILVGLLAVFAFSLWWVASLKGFFVETWRFMSGEQIGREGWVQVLARDFLKVFLFTWLPFGLLCGLAGAATAIYQVGLFLFVKPLIPKLSRLNPISGLKKIVSLRSLVELAKGILKALLLGLVLYLALRKELESIALAMKLPYLQGLNVVTEKIWWLALRMALLLFVIAAFDYAYQRWDFEKSIRMSKKEIKDEYKQMEGDPKVKQRIRQRQRELARRRMMAQVPKADVVITNPTTLAVAIQYERQVMDAPCVVAKGKGVLARRIREIAQEHNVPIVENRALARALFEATDVGEIIPETLYKGVAEVLAFVYKLKAKK